MRNYFSSTRNGLLAGVCLGFMILATSVPASALSPADLLFYAPFDGSLEVAVSAGDPKPEITGQYEFASGMLGKAVLAGEKGKSLSYAVKDNISERQGSISVWVKPLWADWAKTHNFLTIPDYMLSLWYSHNFLIAFSTTQWQLADYPCLFPSAKSEWHHLVITWGNGTCTRYADGKYQSQLTGLTNDLPAWGANNRRFSISQLPIEEGTYQTFDNKMALDELMIFNRPLDPAEVANIYRHGATGLPETTAAIGEVKNAPKIDGVFSPEEWKQTAQLVDFVDRPFGNLSPRPVTANIAYDQSSLYLALRSPAGKNSQENSLEIQLLPKDAKDPYRFVVTADQKLLAYLGSSTAPAEIPWQAKASESCFEAAIPWNSIGLTNPPEGTAVKINILRRWSADYKDFASWSDAADPARYGTILLAGKSPILALDSLGKLNYAQFDLSGKVINPSGTEQALNAEVRLQPSDLKEYYDPKTMPGTKSYTGTQVILDRGVKMSGETTDLRVTSSFSDTDINSLYLKVTGPSGNIIYQAQRTFVAQPPIIVSTKTYPDHDRLEVTADISYYRESPPDTLRAEVQLIAPSGQVVNTARIDTFKSVRETISLPLAALPVGTIKVKTTLRTEKTKIFEFTTSFDKIAPGPWYNNTLGKDDIVIPPFTPVKVAGQSVSVWGRTYQWDNSLFPVQVTSKGNNLLASPIELLAGGVPTGRANPAKVRIVEATDTHAVVECGGTIANIPVTARHRIEYDGMCWTQLEIKSAEPAPLGGLSLHLPFLPQQASLYHYNGSSGGVKKLTAQAGKADIGLRNAVWLGNEDRGMTWFTESNTGWRLGGKVQTASSDAGWKIANAQCISDEGKTVSLTIRFADQPFDLSGSFSVGFGLIATPVKPMLDVRHLRGGQDWGYVWNGVQSGFMRSNNDIANVLPGFKDYMAGVYQKTPDLFILPYVRPDWINVRQPEWNYFREEWQVIPATAINGSDDGGPDRHGTVCLGDGQWQDFLIYYMMKAYDENKMNGYYFDEGRYRCANEFHGHHGEYSILAIREFHKRLAVEFAKRGRPYLFFIHSSGNIELPALSFASMIWSGEEYSMSAVNAGYQSLFSLDGFRTEFLGQQFGIPIQMLTYLKDVPLAEKEGASPAELFARKSMNAFMGLLLLHGTTDLAFNNFAIYQKQAVEPLAQFGYDQKDAQFLPYWNNASSVTVLPADENLACSLWRRPGKVLVIVDNNTQKDQQTTVTLNLKALGLGNGLAVTDTKTGKSLSLEQGVLNLTVEAGNWRMILIEPGR